MKSVQIDRFIVGEMKENTYVVSSKGVTIIIDPGDDWEYISGKIENLGCTPKAILLTHGHFDHTMAAFPLSYMYKIPVYLHPRDQFLLKRVTTTAKKFIGKNIDPVIPPVTRAYDENISDVGFSSLRIIPTPGHTPGSVAFLIGLNVFSGDTLFSGGAVGRTDFTYGDRVALRASVRSLLSLPPNLTVYPGHGEPTTVREERMSFKGSIYEPVLETKASIVYT